MLKRRTYGVVIAATLAASPMAEAYVDPGSGALVWQALLAGLVGSLFYVRRGLDWLRGHLRRNPKREP